MTTLIFETVLDGHHLEYVHHLYIGAVERHDKKYIFALPETDWNEKYNMYEWPKASNIQLVFLNNEALRPLLQTSRLKRMWAASKLIRRMARQFDVNEIFLITFAAVIPILPIILPRRIKASGIVYQIYLRKSLSFLYKLLTNALYALVSHNSSVGKIFILNDAESADRMNRIYRSDKFRNLPDPVPIINFSFRPTLHNEFGLSSDKLTFLHFGALTHRKGTLEILKAICSLSKNELKDKQFIFAGKTNPDFRKEFTNLLHEAQSNGTQIIFFDEFCPYERLHELCHLADCILIPYQFTNLSSGVLGYAAVHKTPVIGPSDGLIGALIRHHSLGITLDCVNAKSIADAINIFKPFSVNTDYARLNSQEMFIETILSN